MCIHANDVLAGRLQAINRVVERLIVHLPCKCRKSDVTVDAVVSSSAIVFVGLRLSIFNGEFDEVAVDLGGSYPCQMHLLCSGIKNLKLQWWSWR